LIDGSIHTVLEIWSLTTIRLESLTVEIQECERIWDLRICRQDSGRSRHRIVPPVLHALKPSHGLRDTGHGFSARQAVVVSPLVLRRSAFHRSHELNTIEQVTKRPDHAANKSPSVVDVHERLLDLPVRLARLENRLSSITKTQDVIDGLEQRVLVQWGLGDPVLVVSRSTSRVVCEFGFLREVESPVLGTGLEVHLLAARTEVAESVDGLDGAVAPEAYTYRLLTLGAILLAGDVVLGCDVGQVRIGVLGQEPKVFCRAVDDVLG